MKTEGENNKQTSKQHQRCHHSHIIISGRGHQEHHCRQGQPSDKPF